MTHATAEGRPKILLALDGSPAAASALPLARALADQLGAVLEVLHVADASGPEPGLWQRLRLELRDEDDVQVRSTASDPATAILHAASEAGVAVVVLATHGGAIAPGRRLGSVAQAVVAGCHRPLLLVRPEVAPPGPSGSPPPRPSGSAPLRHWLLPLDGTPTTTAALRPATDLAGRLGAALDLLHVVAPDAPAPGPTEAGSIGAPRYVDQPHHEWPAWAAHVIDHLAAWLGGRPPGLAMRAFLSVGDIAAEIARFAAEHHSDTIVLVRRSHLELGRARILRDVLEHAPCAVLLVARQPGGAASRDRPTPPPAPRSLSQGAGGERVNSPSPEDRGRGFIQGGGG